MSGDVQPRKRKDKRRKKEENQPGMIYKPVALQKFKNENEKKKIDLSHLGEKIHIQSKCEIGGNIWVKIIFFCLLGLLLGAVGLIYFQSHGSSDVDLPSVEDSRFAEYFTGWLDDSGDNHEHESSEDRNLYEKNEHDEKGSDQEVDSQENEEDESSEIDQMSRLFSFGAHEENEDDKNNDKKSFTNSNQAKESDQGSNIQEDEDENINESENEEENSSEDEDADENRSDVNSNSIEEEEEFNEATEDEEEEDELNNSKEDKEEEEEFSKAKEDDEEEEGASSDNEGSDEEEYDASQEEDDYFKTKTGKKKIKNTDVGEDEEDNPNVSKKSKEKEVKHIWTKANEDLGYEEIDESEEYDFGKKYHKKREINKPHEKVIRPEINLLQDRKPENLEQDENEMNNEETDDNEERGVAMKLGVVIALIIVALLVLVQKWKAKGNASLDETAPKEEIDLLSSDSEPVISRRQTLVLERISFNQELGEDELECEDYSEEECGIGEYSGGEQKEFSKKVIDKIISDSWRNFENENVNIRNQYEKDWDSVGEKAKGEIESEESDYGGEEEEEEEALEEIQDEYEFEEEEDRYEGEEEEEDKYEGEEEIEDKDEENDYREEEEDDDEYDFKPKSLTQKEGSPPIPSPRTHKKSAQSIGDSGEVVEGKTSDSKDREAGNALKPEDSKHSEKKVGSEEDWSFRQEYDYAAEQFENNPQAALSTYEQILSKKPAELKALVGRAKALDQLAEVKMSNAYLKQATNAYRILLLQHGNRFEDEMYEKLAERCIARMRFGGHLVPAIEIHKALIQRFPNSPKYRNNLAVTYLMSNKIELARKLLNETLSLWPRDGFALVHYGFILKTTDNNMEEGAKLLMEGIQTRENGVIDGMFFFHLGDALNRLGRPEEAMEWYDVGVKEGLFLSRYQRSLYNINRLKGRPWWTKEETTYQDFFKRLESNWREIRREGLELLNSKGVNLFKEESENLKDTGDWRQLDLFFRGRKQSNCQKAPVTCSLVSSFKPAAGCTRGQIKFSVMMPNTHVWPHCGPTNCRLRSHLGLVVPEKTYIRVAEETRSWEEGKLFVFDDSFEHEVWHNGTGLRLVLIVDVWHPEVTQNERQSLSPI